MKDSQWYPYEPVIGLEVHVRLDVDTKIFCNDPYEYGKDPNTLIGPVSLAYPGTLPKVNKKAIEYAIKIGIACNSEIADQAEFDRKNYFYPDLPKGYQLTQDRNPICSGGEIRIKTEDGIKHVSLTKIHLEEDAGKSIHSQDTDFSMVDFNRAGTALIEMVTQPELSSPDDAYNFMYEVRRMVRALGIGDGNMEQGSLRCDANVSVRKAGEDRLGTKVEIKNVNSFNNVKKALELEIQRQIALLEEDNEVISESRTFDPVSGSSFGMRVKETLTDYRYFPDPDLTPVIIDEDLIARLKDQIGELPKDKELRYQEEFGLSDLDTAVLTDDQKISDYFEKVVSFSENPKSSANWIMGPVKSVLNERNIEIDELPITPEQLGNIISMVDQEVINQNLAIKQLFPAVLRDPQKNLDELLNDIMGASSEDLNDIVNRIIKEFPEEAELLRNGKTKLIGMFMGEIMKATNGKADPKKAKNILLDIFDNQ